MVRDLRKVRRFDWSGDVVVLDADALKPQTLGEALSGVHTAYYLIHSMKSGAQFERLDKTAAENFAVAARAAGIKHIIYLGGLGREGATLSSHLRSRH